MQIINLECPLDNMRKKNGATSNYWHNLLCSQGLRPPLPEYIPEQLKVAIKSAWSTDPANRPSTEYILEILDVTISTMSAIVFADGASGTNVV
jgi:hypothetical protein